MNNESKSFSEQLSLGEALLEKYFGQDKQLFDQITMEEEYNNQGVLKENKGHLSPNLQEKIENLNRFLLAVGYTPKQVIEQHNDKETALDSAIQLIYQLIQGEQRQKKQQEDWLLSFQQLETKYKRAQQSIEKLERKMEEKDKQHNLAKTKDERQIHELELQLQKWIEECTEWKIKAANWEQLQLQFGYELRKKDKEYQRLQQKLQEIMQQQSRRVGNHKNGESGIPAAYWREQKSSKGLCEEDWLKEEAYRMMESSFQDRIQKLQQENASLKNFMNEIYYKMEQKMVHASIHPQNSKLENEDLHNPLRWKLDLPFESVKEDIQKYFDDKLEQLLSMGSSLWTEEEIQKTTQRDESHDSLISTLQRTTVHSNESTLLYSKEQNGQSSDSDLLYPKESKEDFLSSYGRDNDETNEYDRNESKEMDNVCMPTFEPCTLNEPKVEEEENLDDYL
ncbi:hypothetical protein GpartN1_g7083.t1 [Galdieria partita]|uniref:Uncharacterized protein n=1 Tax=Galdieria partita TaxID=83374 RepID=A0A9C7UU43_9RHOD|nr:hypothetical protein GpartN1_g7083.t1 [Galdieria partita]